MRNQSHTQDPTKHPRQSPTRKQTMVRLDKVIGIPLSVPTPDTQYNAEYIFAKPSTTFMKYYFQLQYLN